MLDHVGGVSVERDLDGVQRIVALAGHGLQVACDAAVGLGVSDRSEAAGDFLLDYDVTSCDTRLHAATEAARGRVVTLTLDISPWISDS